MSELMDRTAFDPTNAFSRQTSARRKLGKQAPKRPHSRSAGGDREVVAEDYLCSYRVMLLVLRQAVPFRGQMTASL